MATTSQTSRDIRTYNQRLARSLPPSMTLTRWKAIKSLIYAGLFAVVAFLAITNDADPTTMGAMTILAMLIVFGMEVSEIQIANILTVTFRERGRYRDRREDD